MPSLKHLKQRIKSIRSSQKITSAMKLVASAKFRQAQYQLLLAREFHLATQRLLQASSLSLMELDSWPDFFQSEEPTSGKILYIILSGQRGLCGGFNNHVVRHVQSTLLTHTSLDFELMYKGIKAQNALTRQWKDHTAAWQLDEFHKQTAAAFSTEFSQKICQFYKEGHYQQIKLIYNHFISPFIQKPASITLLPIIPIDPYTNPDHAWNLSLEAPPTLYEFEPRLEKILPQIVEQYLQGYLNYAVIETQVGEQAARMAAMDQASRNARDMIHQLSLIYNRTRQATITRELIEIISGAHAV